MPYCAKCLIEYVEGTTECEDCGAFLLPGSPPAAPPRLEIVPEKDVKLVAVHISAEDSGMEAELARGILESQGIPCTLSGDVAAGEPFPVMGTHLLVREEDAERAERILQDYAEAEVPSPPEDPEPTAGE
jgi:hypothetical protein